ncbi:unnamed protein product [Rhodiola kirilowii]
MVNLGRSAHSKNPNESMRLIVTTFCGIVLGFFIATSFPTLSMKLNLASSYFSTSNNDRQDFSDSSLKESFVPLCNNVLRIQKLNDTSEIWVPSNPRGAERLPPGIVEPESDYFLRRLWGKPSEDLIKKPKYLVTFTVGYEQKKNIDAAVKKFSDNFSILLFHYDGRNN